MMILNNILRYLVWMIVCFAGMALLILACMVYFGSYVMEWVDENGKGNGHVHEVNSDIGNVLAFRLNDFADSNHYELFLWSLDKINLECNVSVSITKMCRNGTVCRTKQYDLVIGRDSKSDKVIIDREFAPNALGEALRLSFLVKAEERLKDFVIYDVLLTADKVFYVFSV